jgi:mono/diheme cytochrome c family protein
MNQSVKLASGCLLLLAVLLYATPANAQDKAAVEQGVKIYAVQKCNACHSVEGKGAKKGPLDEVGTKLTEEEIRLWLVDAPGMTKKTKATRKPVMKNYAKLPKDEIDALVAYMQSLK